MNKPMVEFKDLGLISFQAAWDIQKKYFKAALNAKSKAAKPKNKLLFCEHNPVYTLGKSGKEIHLLSRAEELGADFFKIDRGGDITFHGPGQIVGYPIFDLEQFNLGLKHYVENLEESVIQFLDEFGLAGNRNEKAIGVWLDAGTTKERKICAIGIKASRYVSMHGFALNINTDLSWFNHIVPCGIMDKGITSLKKEIGKTIDSEAAKKRLATKLANQFGFEFT